MSAPEIEVIRLWIEDGRAREVDSLLPSEIGSARHRDRILDCAIIDGIVYIERKVAPQVREPLGRHLIEVYVADAQYAKNGRGFSSVSAPRMAALLGLSERSVRRLRDLLVEMRLQGRSRQAGLENAIWPIIPRRLATRGISRVWWLDATSAAFGLPAGTPDTQGCPGLGDATPDTGRGDPGHGEGGPRTRGGGTQDTERGDPGHWVYASSSDISGLARERRLRRLSQDIGSAPAGALPMSAESLARDLEALREQWPTPSLEERARVAAMAGQAAAHTARMDRQQWDAAARAIADKKLRAQSGTTPPRLEETQAGDNPVQVIEITPPHLEEALARLRRMQGGSL
jgi:hypothetical protein